LQTKSEYDKLISLLSERSLIKQFQNLPKRWMKSVDSKNVL